MRRHSVGDYVFTFLGFLGLAIPNFILALTLMYVAYKYMGQTVGGLFSQQYRQRAVELGQVRRPPGAPLDPDHRHRHQRHRRADPHPPRQPHRRAQQALRDHRQGQGPARVRVVLKYPVRIALNPFVSAIGWVLPELISGVTITAIVLNLPMLGPLLLRALTVQDMYLAGSYHPAARRADADRHADLRHAARAPRPADPVHMMHRTHPHRRRGGDRAGDRRLIRRSGKAVAIDVAGPWTLIWLKFVAQQGGRRRRRLHPLPLSRSALFAEFLAPALPDAVEAAIHLRAAADHRLLRDRRGRHQRVQAAREGLLPDRRPGVAAPHLHRSTTPRSFRSASS